MNTIGDELRAAVIQATPALLALGEEASLRPSAPGKWCPREVLGHLIDSASNNHQRFVRAQLQEDLVFEGYDQDAWVRLQRYRAVPWRDLVELWRRFNLHLAHVIDGISAETREVPRQRHNLDRIAWRTPAASEPATLEYFLRDYVAHLQHHLEGLGGGPRS